MFKGISGILALSLLMFLQSCSTDQKRPSDPIITAKDDSINVSSGTVDRYYFESTLVDARNVDVWLPEDYSADQRYAVLYMHDGQMLFDSTTTWNHQEWKVDEVAGQLMRDNRINDMIVVGIWNNGEQRYAEYFPEKAIDYIPKNQRDSFPELSGQQFTADQYLKFLVSELKPFIDRTYATHTDAQNTVVMGSSMGGLISLYAIAEYPNIFGGAGCLSTHFMGTGKPNNVFPNAINDYLKTNLPSPENHKLYFDHGTETLDANYAHYQDLIDQTMAAKGFSEENWVTREFEGHDHSEQSWSKRLHIPLEFLLGD